MRPMRGMDSSDTGKPCGNSYSLVPEVASFSVNPGPKAPITKQGAEPKITTSTLRRNNWKFDISGTGLS